MPNTGTNKHKSQGRIQHSSIQIVKPKGVKLNRKNVEIESNWKKNPVEIVKSVLLLKVKWGLIHNIICWCTVNYDLHNELSK